MSSTKIKSTINSQIKGERVTHIDKNLDRNIFLSSKSKFKSYAFEIPIQLDDGTLLTRYIVVGKANPNKGQKDPKKFNPENLDTQDGTGVLTTSHLKAIVALIANWEDRGRPEGKNAFFSIYDLLSNYYDYKQNIGRTDYQYFKRILFELRNIPITFIDAFETLDEDGGVKVLTHSMNVLSDLKIYEEFNYSGQLAMAISSYKLDGITLRNLLGGYTRPILLKPLVKKIGDGAILLYKFANTVLADRKKIEICTRDLFNQLELKDKSYEARGERKRFLQRAMAENEGEPIIDGQLHFELMEGRRRQDDHKLIIKKLPRDQKAEESEQLNQVLLPDETKDIPADKRPHYLFLKDQKISYAADVIKQSPHSPEVLDLINEEFHEKLTSGFAFRNNPKAWLVSAYRNVNFEPHKPTKTQTAAQDEQAGIKSERLKKQRQITELKESLEKHKQFLELNEEAQLQQLVRDQYAAFFGKYKRWPKSQEDRKLLEQECRELLPKTTKERHEWVRKIKIEIEKLLDETTGFNNQLKGM